MELSVAETATVLGKSLRQVRYMIRQGQLKATRRGRRWQVDGGSLPLDASARRALQERVEVARESFDAALEPARKAATKEVESKSKSQDQADTTERYSVRKLLAFETARPLYAEVSTLGAEAAPAQDSLFEAIIQLTQGCHAFHASEKAQHFREARRQVATTTAHLYLREDPRALELAERLEQELIPKIGGLVAAQEKHRKKSSRFERLGSKNRGER